MLALELLIGFCVVLVVALAALLMASATSSRREATMQDEQKKYAGWRRIHRVNGKYSEWFLVAMGNNVGECHKQMNDRFGQWERGYDASNSRIVTLASDNPNWPSQQRKGGIC